MTEKIGPGFTKKPDVHEFVIPKMPEEIAKTALDLESEQKIGPGIMKKSEKTGSTPELSFKTIDFEESREILDKTNFDADPYKETLLTKAYLGSNGFAPTFYTKVGMGMEDGHDVWFSNIYNYKNRPAVVAYVDDGGGNITARTYYKSNSQHVWRFLPDYKEDAEGNINWYGKGANEHSLTLPADLQKALSEIQNHNDPFVSESVDTGFIFAGTARKFGSRASDYYREVNKFPTSLLKIKNFELGKEKQRPENIVVPDGKMPQLNNRIFGWTQNDGGKTINAETFISKDGTLMYTMFTDEQNRAWVGNIETVSMVSSTGLNEDWVDGGDLLTPVEEYKFKRKDGSIVDQTGGYGDEENRNGRYLDMYKNYLSKIPLIIEYQKYLSQKAA